MPFNIDSYRIFRAIQSAGIDPDNSQLVEQFTQAIITQLQRIPADRRANFTQKDWNRVVDLAADQMAAEPGMNELRQRGQANDPTALWELTELGKRGRERRAATEDKATRRPADPVRGMEPQPNPANPNVATNYGKHIEAQYNPANPDITPNENPAPMGKPKRVDLDALWRQAKEQGKI